MLTKLYLLRAVLILHMTGDRRGWRVCRQGQQTEHCPLLEPPPAATAWSTSECFSWSPTPTLPLLHLCQLNTLCILTTVTRYTSVNLMLDAWCWPILISVNWPLDVDHYSYLSTERLLLTTTHICHLSTLCVKYYGVLRKPLWDNVYIKLINFLVHDVNTRELC